MKFVKTLGGLAFGVCVLLSPRSAGFLSAQAPTAREGQVTFSKDVAPIFQRSCQNCHRPGSIAPMSLMTYEDARPWARSIRRRIAAREMPPWYIEKNVGIQEFKDDISLSDADIATITVWIDGGLLKGNPADMPPPRKFDDLEQWRIGKPDLVVRVPQDWTIPAEGPDAWIESIAPTGLTEDRYVKAMQTRPGPGTLKVIHHVTTTMRQQGGDAAEEQFLSEYSLGKNAEFMPEGSGILLKAGSMIKFQVHYHSYGEEVVDTRAGLGFVFYPKGVVPKYVEVRRSVGNPVHGNINGIDVPANDANVRIDGYTRLDKPTRVVAFQAHMHARGKRMCMEAILPNMDVETLSCTKYDFNWNLTYTYADDVAPLLPAGTLLHIIGWHDNSAGNRLNRDPRNWVGWGARTVDDMSFAWVAMVSLDQADFDRMVAERKAKHTN
ncbi:MAG: hypothetical protein HY047_19845 [Acidobacteria bacterium]|nr:hypothetical protein [Acidobacteriota bacterium]